MRFKQLNSLEKKLQQLLSECSAEILCKMSLRGQARNLKNSTFYIFNSKFSRNTTNEHIRTILTIACLSANVSELAENLAIAKQHSHLYMASALTKSKILSISDLPTSNHSPRTCLSFNWR